MNITSHTLKNVKNNMLIHVAGETLEDAQKDISNPTEYVHVLTESIEYDNAEKAVEIAHHLGKGWEAFPMSRQYKDCGFYFKNSEGLELFMTKVSWNKPSMFTFYYSCPRTSKGRTADVYDEGCKVSIPSINCSKNKDSAKIAKDITNRLLAEAKRVHALYLEAIEREEACYIKEAAIKEVVKGLKDSKGVRFDANGSSVRISGYCDAVTAQKISDLLNS